jgi:hypothetical protein
VLSKKNIFGVFKLIFIQDLSCGSNISSWIYLLKSIFILNSFLSGKSLSNIFLTFSSKFNPLFIPK